MTVPRAATRTGGAGPSICSGPKVDALRVSPAKPACSPAEQGHEDRQVLPHVAGRLLERQAEHVLDDQLMGEADAEGETTAGGRLHREGLAGQHHRMAGIGRDDGRSEADRRAPPGRRRPGSSGRRRRRSETPRPSRCRRRAARPPGRPPRRTASRYRTSRRCARCLSLGSVTGASAPAPSLGGTVGRRTPRTGSRPTTSRPCRAGRPIRPGTSSDLARRDYPADGAGLWSVPSGRGRPGRSQPRHGILQGDTRGGSRPSPGWSTPLAT